MLFQKCNNSSLNGQKKSTASTSPCISIAPLFPRLTKTFLGCKEASKIKGCEMPHSCALAPTLSRLWRNLFPKGISPMQRLYAEPYNSVNKSNYLHNVAESTGLAALGHNHLGFTAQRLYQINPTSSLNPTQHNSSEHASEYDFFAHNRENADIPWEDFQLYDSDSESDSGNESSLFAPMFAPLSEVHQARPIHEEKWERHSRTSSSNPETEQGNRRRGFLHTD
ncbi:hypothetical protein K7432_012681 [Basidiobolus ranarum]|uniref:Uncharacterized protein n=1 Tax=Basidiobolus ranarum TaxID=34480 RepID=A0ABR2WKF1_9FUNG